MTGLALSGFKSALGLLPMPLGNFAIPIPLVPRAAWNTFQARDDSSPALARQAAKTLLFFPGKVE